MKSWKIQSKIFIAILAIVSNIAFAHPSYSANKSLKPQAAGRTATSLSNTILNGVLAPKSTQGIDGDFFIDTKALNIYGPKTNGRWPTAISLRGTQGVAGTTGTSGSNGTDGRNAQSASAVVGAQGAQGAQAAPGQLPGSIGPQGPKSTPPDISCGAKDPVVSGKKILGQTILPAVTACNVKAWTGGLIVVLGMQFLALGVIVVGLGIGQETKAGQAVKRTAKKAGGVVVTRRASGSSLTKPASATSAARTMAA